MPRQKQSDVLHHLTANSIRFLATDAVQKANSGHPGMPMGMANVAAVLWTEYLNHNPRNPHWKNRDRFILSAGHGSMLLYAVLHLSGYDVTHEDLKNFRQWESKTPGHPEYGMTPGVETTTGPLGQGFANGVGMALSARWLSEKFSGKGEWKPLDHYIYAIVSDGDLMEGISHEAASVAGHLSLGQIIYFYDDNSITIEGETDLAFSENTEQRFSAYGWHVQTIDGHNPDEIRAAIESAQAEKSRPSIIITKTHIGFGSPNKQDKASSHGAPLGEDEILMAKENLGWPEEPAFFVPETVYQTFEEIENELVEACSVWEASFEEWCQAEPELTELWNNIFNPEHPADLVRQLLDAIPEKAAATRVMGGQVLQKAAEIYPGLLGGSADLAPSTKTFINDSSSITGSDFSGRNIHFGIREHAMGAIMNGMAVYGGTKPFGSTFFVFADYMRPPIRLAALMEIPSIFVFTHDSLFVGEDGPTHQPVEHLASLRIIPNTDVFRPADRVETAAAWASALTKENGPTVICLTRQNVNNIVPETEGMIQAIGKGAYVLLSEPQADLVVAASGSELELAQQACMALKEQGLKVQLASVPSLDVFNRADKSYQRTVFPENVPTVVIEAGLNHGWHEVMAGPMLFIGMDGFGASAPAKTLAEKMGLTVEGVLSRINSWEVLNR